MKHKTFLGLYKNDDTIPFEIKFLILVGLCTFYVLDGLIVAKAVILGVLLSLCLIFGRMRFLKFIKVLIISSFILFLFWLIFVQKITSTTLITEIMSTIQSESYIKAIFRLFGLVVPGWLFMSVTSEHELLSTLRRYKAKPNVILFFVVAFNTIAHFITSFKTISMGYRMRVVKKHNALSKLVYILTTLLFNCIVLITKAKKVYFLYENRIKNTLLIERVDLVQSVSFTRSTVLDINVDNVSYGVIKLSCLDSFSQKLTIGKCAILTGDIGTGKTTLLNIISGIIPNIINCNYSGEVLLDGSPFSRECVDYVFQHSENSLFYDTVARQLSHIITDKRLYWLQKFNIDDLHDKAISDLSIGQCKIVSLISCLLSNASVCLLDEPTAHLDNNAITTFLLLLSEVIGDKIIIISSHDKSIFEKFDVKISLGYSKLLGDASLESAVSMKKETSKIAHISQLSYSYPDGTNALSNVNFDVYGGEIVGLLGANGSGKSTLSILIAEAAEGHYKNTALQIIPKSTVAIMLQNTDLQFFTTSVKQEISFGILFTSDKKKRAEKLLELFELQPLYDEPPQFLSEGQKKCLLIICMLLSEPDILILDEPFDSLDSKMKKKLRAVLHDYINWTEGKKAIIINDQDNCDFCTIATQYILLPNRKK